MPVPPGKSGADLEYDKMLVLAGYEPDEAAGLDGARLEQEADSGFEYDFGYLETTYQIIGTKSAMVSASYMIDGTKSSQEIILTGHTTFHFPAELQPGTRLYVRLTQDEIGGWQPTWTGVVFDGDDDIIPSAAQSTTFVFIKYASSIKGYIIGKFTPSITVVHHGTDGNVARPVDASLVYWIGTATPANGLAYDFWLPENV